MLLAKEHKALMQPQGHAAPDGEAGGVIEKLQNGNLAAEFAGKNAPREIEKLRDELHQVRRDIAERDMAMEYERKTREQEERELEEEIRKLMAEDVGRTPR